MVVWCISNPSWQPDLHGTVEDSDWEHIEDAATTLREAIVDWADTVRSTIKAMAVDLPAGCVGRAKDKWRPLKRVAVAAGGDWPHIADRLIGRGMAEDAAEHEAGLRQEPPGMVLLRDVHAVWPGGADFVPTYELVNKVIEHNRDYWGPCSSYGKQLTDTRFGRIITQASRVTSSRPVGAGTEDTYGHSSNRSGTDSVYPRFDLVHLAMSVDLA